MTSGGEGAPALWPAVVFGFAGWYVQARKKGLGRFAARSRYYAAATLSTLMSVIT